jgi:predicted acetyltransferase
VIREAVNDLALSEVEVRSAGLTEKDVVDQLLELYLHDLSGLTGADVGSHGRYGYFFLDDYWIEPDRHPFLLRVDGHLAGVALVGSGTPHDMAEFFVMRKYRRQRVGARAARALFRMFPGDWQVRQIAANTAATSFWRAVIPAPFTEGTTEIGPVQRFESSAHDD